MEIINGEYQIRLPFNMKDRIKEEFFPRKFDWDGKLWTAPVNARNKTVVDQLAYEMGKLDNSPFSKYDLPLSHQIGYDTLCHTLWPDQREMYDHIFQRRQCILAAWPRRGKTLPALTALFNMWVMYTSQGIPMLAKDILWLAPVSALKGLVPEKKKWSYLIPMLEWNYDEFRTNWKEDSYPPRMVVFDEAHLLKTPTSMVSECARDLVEKQIKFFGDNCIRVLLTGTPAPRFPTDWWNLAEIAFPGWFSQGCKGAFENLLMNKTNVEGSPYPEIDRRNPYKIEEVAKVYHKLTGLAKVYLKSDKAPVIKNVSINIKPTAKQVQYVTLLMNSVEKAAELQCVLREVSDGIYYSKEIIKGKEIITTINFPTGKDAKLLEDLEQYSNVGRVIIYAAFKGSIDKLLDLIPADWIILKADGRGWKVYNTLEYDAEYLLNCMDASFPNRIKKLVFLANADSAATGLELSSSPVTIYYSCGHNGANHMQSRERNCSQNARFAIATAKYYCCLPVDRLVAERLRMKQSAQAITMNDLTDCMLNPITEVR